MPVSLSRLPDPVIRDVRSLRRAFGDPRAEVAAYRTRRSVVRRVTGALESGPGDGPILLVTFRGTLRYDRARNPPGQPDVPVRGRFAFSTYDLRGRPSGLGVLPRAPAPDALRRLR